MLKGAMHISIILAHPNPGSFNHAIAKAAGDELRRDGHKVTSTTSARNNSRRS